MLKLTPAVLVVALVCHGDRPAARRAGELETVVQGTPFEHVFTVPNTASGEKPLGNAVVIIDEFPSVVIDPALGADLRVPGSGDGVFSKPNEAQMSRFAAN